MLGPQRMKRITEQVLARSRADQTEVVLWSEESALTRFANSGIHQNVAERNAQVRVRVVTGRRVGVATANDTHTATLRELAERALEMARLQPENPGFRSLPAPQPVPTVKGFVAATADCSPERRAQGAATICRMARENALVASGAFSTSAVEVFVANSLGVFAYSPSTVAELTTVIMSPDSSGFASVASPDVDAIDAEKLGGEALRKTLRSRHPRPLEPGEYAVVLEEYAVAELLSYLSYLGFSALAVQEGRSFMADRIGQRLTGQGITIWDDGLDPSGLPMPFDYEGVPKRRVNLITDGVAEGVVYDSYTANREGKESTGHALPAPNTFGPLPGNLFLKAGTASKEEMLASIDRGVWVTRFHYVNPVHPLKTVLTGMTRDGTFFIEKGEIRHAAKNLRFTQSVLEALDAAIMIGRDTKLMRGFYGGVRVPALCLRGFTFTGATEF